MIVKRMEVIFRPFSDIGRRLAREKWVYLSGQHILLEHIVTCGTRGV